MEESSSDEPRIDRSSLEGISNGIASMFSFDTDDDDDSENYCGPKPSELYGKYTWKIDKFSQIHKRELRSNAFEVGGHKWYILLYPKGCDVKGHISLFLCVANHDKLPPGWSQIALFTMNISNKDPRKSKYNDSVHRFWKKEHDWGWKKYMQLSKLQNDGFLDADTLTIKVRVQVIRDRADCPFRCLDSDYKSELAMVYMSNVEKICNRFVLEKRLKLAKVIRDKVRWSSFCDFWRGMDQESRRLISSEKSNLILKLVVEQFFVEKEVSKALVMESLYSGLKALKSKAKSNKAKGNCVAEEVSVSVVMENDKFILVYDDALLLFEREVFKPLRLHEEKDHQNKHGGSGNYIMDSVKHDKRRLTRLGQRTIETFVLDHIFSKIEIARQEVVSLKMQDELIHEEEEEEAPKNRRSK